MRLFQEENGVGQRDGHSHRGTGEDPAVLCAQRGWGAPRLRLLRGVGEYLEPCVQQLGENRGCLDISVDFNSTFLFRFIYSYSFD